MMKRIAILAILLISLCSLCGCSTYGYEFHFSVIGDNGEISLENKDNMEFVKSCSDSRACNKGCNETSKYFIFRGSKRDIKVLTFIAEPNDGYQVKEWRFNGEVVEENKSNTFTATVTYKDDYYGIISVKFEPIEN